TRFEGNELYARRIACFGSALYASPDYLAQNPWTGESPRGEDGAASAHSIITVLEDQAHLPEAKWLHQVLPLARVVVQSNSRDAQLYAALAGLGIACLSRYQADREQGLRRLTTPRGPSREVWLGVHADIRQMPRIRAMIEALDSEIAAQAPLFDPE
ncbi:MAG: LysR family transcriptional regulator, partial [Alphaproteobacteria bacterium]|nr:LysR family transcriptional regulator [Alphaproteobacteria bacterium]